MTWSYSGDPRASMNDTVRFLVGDVTQTAQSLSDEELNYLSSVAVQPPDVYRIAADVADQLATRYLSLSSSMKKIGDLQLATDYGATYQRYLDLSKKLMKGRTKFNLGVPVFADTDQPVFSIGLMDDPSNTSPKTGYY
jgi:hypothetical protein